MEVRATSGSTTAPGTGTQKSQLGRDDFMKLLLTQLRNQDPLKPMDDIQFITQLAQFNTLEKMQEMDERMGLLLEVEQLAEAKGLIGKEVEARVGGSGETVKGKVTAAKMVDGSAQLTVGDKTVKMSDVLSVSESLEARLAEASNLIGKEVEAKSGPSGDSVKGTVDLVKVVDGNLVLMIGGSSVKLGDVVSVAEGDK